MSILRLDNTSEQNILNMLMENKIINAEQMKQIQSVSKEVGTTRLETALNRELTNEVEIRKTLSESYSLPIVELKKYKLDDKLKNIKTITRMDPELYAASISDINNFINRIKISDPKITEKEHKTFQAKKKPKVEEVEDDSGVIAFVDKVILDAITIGASDIHIEPYKTSSRIRYRIDGILKIIDEHTKYLNQNHSRVVARVKMLSNLDIAEKRKPQDGSHTFQHNDSEVDLRISILPTKYNERVVMRILSKEAGEKTLEELGFDFDRFKSKWEEGFSHLEHYIEVEGNPRVPKRFKSPDGYFLGSWVNTQRRSKQTLTHKQISKLNSVGFDWDYFKTQWEECFLYLKNFVLEEGHAIVPRSYKTKDGFALGNWVSAQRTNKKKIKPERKSKLDSLGFVWKLK